ncbi:thiolase family protein [Microbacterium pseudoresistens]|uniref:Acetyl-CoA acetyltransferase n=1 Tax=Microbacterium pseudoresistens TaxID=640634 RepID=A0A7Y9EV97_9MICO|nr:thiolase family protein [Microbacterium pseudoresistens]NYD54613.1 acetyl-CoA acetyltransferase [Microbacterium pseudoresistens]
MSHVTRAGGDAAIVGIGRRVIRRGAGQRPTALQLGVGAAVDALRDAGVTRDRIGAFFTGRAPQSHMALQYNQVMLSELKINPEFNTSVSAHGAGALGGIALAMTALESGAVDYALCVTNEAAGIWLDQARTNPAWEADLQFEGPYGVSTPALYAQFAARYQHRWGILAEDAAKLCVENRRWALEHPDAAMRDKGPLTVEDVLASPLIASPFRLFDCAVWYPGAIATALVLTRADIAADVHAEPVYISGLGQSTTHERVTERLNAPVGPSGEPFELFDTGAAAAAKQAYERAGISPRDLDLVETSAPFSYVALMMLEELGICERGGAGRFVAEGGIDFDGGLPFNTNGGYLSFGQVAQGLYMLTEAIDQIRGRAAGRQVADAHRALIHSHGGPLASHAVCIIGDQHE